MAKINSACTSSNEHAIEDEEIERQIERAKLQTSEQLEVKEWAWEMSRKVDEDDRNN